MILKSKTQNTNINGLFQYFNKNTDIIKIVVSNKVSFGKVAFKHFIGQKDTKKLDPYAYFFQK